jgi:heme A synthase
MRGRRAVVLGATAAAATLLTFTVIVLGSDVRVTESGMGCRSWPLCNGHVGPIDRFHPLLEQVHRYAVSLLVVVTVVVVVLACRWATRLVARVALAAGALLVVQALLGAVTVWAHNAPATVALHLMFAELFLGTITAVLVGSLRVPFPSKGAVLAGKHVPQQAGQMGAAGAPERSPRPGALAGLTLVATLGVFASGSAVTETGASGSCRAWPVCGLDGNPTQLVAVQYLHRGAVLVLLALLVALVWRAWRSWCEVRWARGLGVAIVVLLAAQVGAGAVVAVLGAPDAGQDVHLALASALWSCTVALVSVAYFTGWLPAAPTATEQHEQTASAEDLSLAGKASPRRADLTT